jgi:hypothetical protein
VHGGLQRIQEERLDDGTEVAWAVDEEMDFNEQLVFDEDGRARTIPRKASEEKDADEDAPRATAPARVQLLKRPAQDQGDKCMLH